MFLAPRSGRVVLSHPSSLQGPSDIPPSLTPILPVSSSLIIAYHHRSRWRRWDFRSGSPSSLSACRWPYPGSPAGAHALCFPAGIGLPHKRKGSTCIPLLWVCPATGLSQQSPSGVSSRGCTIRFMLRPADLASTPGWVRPSPFQQEPPRCPVEASSTGVLPPRPASSGV